VQVGWRSVPPGVAQRQGALPANPSGINAKSGAASKFLQVDVQNWRSKGLGRLNDGYRLAVQHDWRRDALGPSDHIAQAFVYNALAGFGKAV
jgi:hypothetical protein